MPRVACDIYNKKESAETEIKTPPPKETRLIYSFPYPKRKISSEKKKFIPVSLTSP